MKKKCSNLFWQSSTCQFGLGVEHVHEAEAAIAQCICYRMMLMQIFWFPCCQQECLCLHSIFIVILVRTSNSEDAPLNLIADTYFLSCFGVCRDCGDLIF